MSDIPRFAFFSDGMREGYSESWVRSSDYDALRAERDALAKAINDHNTGCRLACLSMDVERCRLAYMACIARRMREAP